jgi:hypothetical protein
LQLARDFFTIFHIHKLLNLLLPLGGFDPRQINRDAEQTTRRTLNLDQVIAQAGDDLRYDFLQCHATKFRFKQKMLQKLSATSKNNRPKKTGGKYPPVWS